MLISTWIPALIRLWWINSCIIHSYQTGICLIYQLVFIFKGAAGAFLYVLNVVIWDKVSYFCDSRSSGTWLRLQSPTLDKKRIMTNSSYYYCEYQQQYYANTIHQAIWRVLSESICGYSQHRKISPALTIYCFKVFRDMHIEAHILMRNWNIAPPLTTCEDEAHGTKLTRYNGTPPWTQNSSFEAIIITLMGGQTVWRWVNWNQIFLKFLI